MSDSRPVGLFDSGVGGLTVFMEISKLLPHESTVYFGDTIHVPYGSRQKDELIGFASKIIAFLISRNVKYIIFACNTSSSLSLPVVRKCYSVPMIGLVEPGVKEALKLTKNKRIGIIATEATVRSGAYQREVYRLDSSIFVYAQPAPRLVPLVELGMSESQKARQAVYEYVLPLKNARIDTLVLGCTHYPYLISHFKEFLGPGVKLVDPARATVLAAKEEMSRLGILNNPGGKPYHHYCVSGSPSDFLSTAQRFLGFDIASVKQVKL